MGEEHFEKRQAVFLLAHDMGKDQTVLDGKRFEICHRLPPVLHLEQMPVRQEDKPSPCLLSSFVKQGMDVENSTKDLS